MTKIQMTDSNIYPTINVTFSEALENGESVTIFCKGIVYSIENIEGSLHYTKTQGDD